MKESSLYLRVPEYVHKKAKECAIRRNITLRVWISRLLMQGIIRDTQYLKRENDNCDIKTPHCHCNDTCNKHCNTCHIDCYCLDYKQKE